MNNSQTAFKVRGRRVRERWAADRPAAPEPVVVLAAAFFASCWLGESVRRGILVRNITRVSKRLFGVPEFHYYAIVDGIARLFNGCGIWCRKRHVPGTAEMQPELPCSLQAEKWGKSTNQCRCQVPEALLK